ncbi:MAG: hypothetical protein ABH872_02635 [Candidatus Omnitrophota bacterium]
MKKVTLILLFLLIIFLLIECILRKSFIPAYCESFLNKKVSSGTTEADNLPDRTNVKSESLTALRNPFLTAEEQKVTNEREIIDYLPISGVFQSPGRSYVIISGRILKVNDTIDGKEIVSIDKEKVILRDLQGEAEYILFLNK